MTILKKYIPQKWDEIIGQDEIVDILKTYDSVEKLPHLMFVGESGVGKTALAHVIANELDIDLVEYNSSDDRGIGMIREKIRTLLFTTGERIILLEESDSMTEPAQSALRRIMEVALEKTKSRLIFTVNREYRMLEPIISRCGVFHFKPLSEESVKKILLKILKTEGAKFESKEEIRDIIGLILKSANGDARKAVQITDKVLTSERKSVISMLKRDLIQVDLTMEVFNHAVKGDWDKCLLSLENLLISQQVDERKVIPLFYKGLETVDLEPAEKFPLYKALADTERALKHQCSPLIQFAGFLMTVIAVSHK